MLKNEGCLLEVFIMRLFNRTLSIYDDAAGPKILNDICLYTTVMFPVVNSFCLSLKKSRVAIGLEVKNLVTYYPKYV